MKKPRIISSFSEFVAAAARRWWLHFFVLLFVAGGCTVQLYPPIKEIVQLPPAQVQPVTTTPDGGIIPSEFSSRPRFYWEQIEQSDTAYSFAVTDGSKDGRWLDSMRWLPAGPFVTVGPDTLATRAYARASGQAGGASSFFIGADSGSDDEILNGETLDIVGELSSGMITQVTANNELTLYWFPMFVPSDTILNNDDQFAIFNSVDGVRRATMPVLKEFIQDDFGNNLLQEGDNIQLSYNDASNIITISATGVDTSTTNEIQTLSFTSPSLSISDGNSVDLSAIDTDTQLSNEQVQDIVGGMVTGNTETGITVTYDDAGNSLDFVVTASGISSFDWGSDSGNTTITDGETIRVLGSSNGIDVTGTGNDKTVDLDFLELGSAIGVSSTNDYFIAVSSVGTEKKFQGEEVKDWIGAMVSGNTESGISVTYQSADQTFDFSATDNSATNESWSIAGDTGSESGITQADGTITFAGGTGISTAYNSTSNTLTISSTGGSGMTSWTWGGDASTTGITDGETVRVQASTGLDAALSGNIVTVSYDLTELSAISGVSVLDQMLVYDQGTASHRYIAPTEFMLMDQESSGAATFDNRSGAPSAIEGGVYYDTDDSQLKLYTGASWGLIAMEENVVAKYSGFTEYTTTASLSPADGTVIFCDPIEGGSSFTLTINPANLVSGDKLLIISNSDVSNALTVATSGAQVFYGIDKDVTSGTIVIGPGGGQIQLIYDGTNFFIIDIAIP